MLNFKLAKYKLDPFSLLCYTFMQFIRLKYVPRMDNMNCYEELKARGLIAQVTNEEEISKMINNGEATFYIGFDPTADSLHVGHFMALCLMKSKSPFISVLIRRRIACMQAISLRLWLWHIFSVQGIAPSAWSAAVQV